jgi:hypothetical protein
MPSCSLRKMIFASLLCTLPILLILPFSFGGVSVGIPVGKTISSGVVSIAGSSAPSGTVVLSGERIVAQKAPVQIAFRQGGSVLLNEGAGATFSQNGDLLLIQADSGTMSFNFLPGENVRVQTGSRSYVSSESGSIGEIKFTPSGESVSVASGNLYALNVTTNAASTQTNKGSLTKGGDSFTDSNAKWKANELKDGRLDVSGKQFKIVSNTDKTIKIQGTFSLETGSYTYAVVMTPPPAIKSTKSTPTKSPSTSGGLLSKNNLIIIGTAAGATATAGIIAWQVTKSP